MATCITRVLLSAVILAFLSSICMVELVAAAREETMLGTVVKKGKRFVIEADDGDYIAKGKDISKLVGKLVEVTGLVTESPEGDVIEIKAVEDIQQTSPE